MRCRVVIPQDQTFLQLALTAYSRGQTSGPFELGIECVPYLKAGPGRHIVDGVDVIVEDVTCVNKVTRQVVLEADESHMILRLTKTAIRFFECFEYIETPATASLICDRVDKSWHLREFAPKVAFEPSSLAPELRACVKKFVDGGGVLGVTGPPHSGRSRFAFGLVAAHGLVAKVVDMNSWYPRAPLLLRPRDVLICQDFDMVTKDPDAQQKVRAFARNLAYSHKQRVILVCESREQLREIKHVRIVKMELHRIEARDAADYFETVEQARAFLQPVIGKAIAQRDLDDFMTHQFDRANLADSIRMLQALCERAAPQSISMYA